MFYIKHFFEIENQDVPNMSNAVCGISRGILQLGVAEIQD